MISEASRDTEDWSYDAVLASQKLYIIENCNNFTILVFFSSNKCSLGEYRRLNSKT